MGMYVGKWFKFEYANYYIHMALMSVFRCLEC